MSRNSLRLALVQENPVVGDVSGNVEIAIRALSENKTADLVVLSECFVSGYPVQDLVLRPGFLRQISDGLNRLRDMVVELAGPAMLVGAPMPGATLPYNAAYLIEPNGSVRTVRKVELPNSDVFDEVRTFASAAGERARPLSFRGFELGVMICEDMWHGDVARSLADELADVFLVLNGSPYQRGKQHIRIANARRRVKSAGLPLVYVNQVGGQDELVFDGGTFVMDARGMVVAEKAFDTATILIDLVRMADGTVDVKPVENPLYAHDRYPSDLIEADYRACVMGLRDYVLKTGSQRIFVGVSGGLDSALVLTMAVDAIGADRVVGVMMPTRFTGGASRGLADDLMERLRVLREVLPIEDAFTAVADAVNPASRTLASTLGVTANLAIAEENFQARIRGMALMGLSNALGGIVLSTGNKSEMSVGYATLYGDMCGGYNPLKDVWKSRAFQMAKWRNLRLNASYRFLGPENPIPVGIITRPPTAELRDGQTDQDSLGDYDALDCVLKALIEDRCDPLEAAAILQQSFTGDELPAMIGNLEPSTYAQKIARMVRNAQYKRVQAPPGVKLNPTAFGLGWRYPIAGNYRF